MTRPRVAPGGLRELGPVNWLLCRILSRFAGTRDAHHIRLLHWLQRKFALPYELVMRRLNDRLHRVADE